MNGERIVRHCIHDGCGVRFEYKAPYPYEPEKLRPFFMWYCDKHKWAKEPQISITEQRSDQT